VPRDFFMGDEKEKGLSVVPLFYILRSNYRFSGRNHFLSCNKKGYAEQSTNPLSALLLRS
jgi:hypothetical protein